jgi:hypothetical protein
MFKKPAALLVSSAIALLALAVQPVVAAATGTGTLFAVFGETQIVKLDPATGTMTTLADLTDPTLQFGSTIGDLVSDAAHHRLIAQQVKFNFDPNQDPQFFETYQLVTVDTVTGAVTVSPDMGGERLSLAFNSASGELFGLTGCCPARILKIDIATGAEAPFVTFDGDTQVSSIAIAPGLHVIYAFQRTPNVFPATGILLSIDTVTGAVSTGPALDPGIALLSYDTSSGVLYGKTFSIPVLQLVSISTSTGTETTIGNFDLGFGGNSLTIDVSTHTIYLMEDIQEAFGFFQQVGAVNPQTGAISLSPRIPLTGYIRSLVFESPVVTPAMLAADVRAAIASHAIDNQGVGAALLAELNAAEAARERGDCTTAAKLYTAFINDLTAQSGKHVDGTTATQLIGEAQTIAGNCP